VLVGDIDDLFQQRSRLRELTHIKKQADVIVLQGMC
jgi:hypothetical protein